MRRAREQRSPAQLTRQGESWLSGRVVRAACWRRSPDLGRRGLDVAPEVVALHLTGGSWGTSEEREAQEHARHVRARALWGRGFG